MVPRVKCYFDVVCPNSWITIQTLNSHASLFEKVEFEPVCDFKIGILHNGRIWNQRRKRSNSRIWKPKKEELPEEPEPEGIIRRIDERGKKLIKNEKVKAPEDWEKTYKAAVSRGSVVPQLFLTSIKERCPDLYENAIEHIGHRLWTSKQPVHYGCHMSTVSRELGIPFTVAEDIVARLSTPENRNILHKNCWSAVELNLTEAPGVVLMKEDGEHVKFDTVNELLDSDLLSSISNLDISSVSSTSSSSGYKSTSSLRT